jgi:hypothetical protein
MALPSQSERCCIIAKFADDTEETDDADADAGLVIS